MSTRLIIDGNSVYEIDEDCLACSERLDKENRKEKEKERETKKTGDRVEHRGGRR